MARSRSLLGAILVLLSASACGRTGTYEFAPFFPGDAGGSTGVPPDLSLAVPDGARPRPFVVAVTCGFFHTCARLSDGTARCWGANGNAQLGFHGGSSTSAQTVAGLTDVVAIAAGLAHTCALGGDGLVRCLGSNYDGELDDAVTEDHPVPVVFADAGSVTAVFTGADDTFLLHADGSLFALGENDRGELGVAGISGPSKHVPTPVVLASGGFTQVAASDGFTCARLDGGAARCWGWNNSGQLGRGNLNDSPTPIPVAGLTDVAQVATGDHHACALHQGGTVSCWGANLSGAVGDGTNLRRLLPVPVVGLTHATQIAAGGDHSCARIDDGTVRCWGANLSGQLGDGSQSDRFTATTVVGLTGVTQVSLGRVHTCVLRGAGHASEVRCWGGNDSGQLGDHTVATRTRPTRIDVIPSN